MTDDQTKCPHCGADMIAKTSLRVLYRCGSISSEEIFQQSPACELLELRAKVAAQQELLREAAEALRDLHYLSGLDPEYNNHRLMNCRDTARDMLLKLDAAK